MKTPTNTARDLLLLAMIAHSNKKYDTAGSLFSASLASSDIEDLVNTLHTMTDEPGVSQSSALTFDPHRDDSMSISAIASVLAAAMEEEDESQAEDGDEDLAGDEAGDEDVGEEDVGEDAPGEDDGEDDGEDGGEDLDSSTEEEPVVDSTALYDDGDDSTDDMDPDSPGDTLLPSSISSVVYEEEQAPQVSTSSGIKRVLAPRIRPDLGCPDDAEEANASDNIESAAKSPAAATAAPATAVAPIQEFASVLPAGRSPVTLRR